MKESFEAPAFSEPRLVTPEEWEKLKDIRTRAIADSPQAFGDTLEETMFRDNETWQGWAQNAKNYVIESAGKFVASATFRQDTDGTWMINGVWTDPAYRGRGLSKRLFEQIFNDARDSGISSIELGVNPSLEPAVNFYRSLGFKVIDHHPSERMGDGNEHPQDVMRIDLD